MTHLNFSKNFLLLLSLTLYCFGPQSVRAQSHGTFSAVGDMKTARSGHTGTLMLNGMVLISGGFSRSLETFDPATGEFTPGGESEFAPRSAVLLPSGKVLLLSFSDKRTLWGQLYNPVDGTTGAGYALMDTEFQRGLEIYYAGLLLSGRILIITNSPEYYNVFDLYELQENPSAERYSATKKDDFFANFYEPGATLPLADGRVLIGICCPGRIYDPRTGVLGLAGSGAASFAFYGYRGVLLTSGKVLTTGGNVDFGPMANTTLFDPATSNFVAAGPTLNGRDYHEITMLGDGKVLLSGGGTPFFADSELYDTSSASYAPTADMIAARAGHSATLLSDGRVLIAGGFRLRNPRVLAGNAEIFTPPVMIPAPTLFSLTGDGSRQGAILRVGTGRPATPANPTRAGEALEIYLTGLLDGAVIPPQVSIGGRMAEVLYFGRAPGLANTNQVNVRVPAGVAPGPAVPVRMMYLGRPSNEVTIAVQ